jgi:hypothetical protein
VGSAKRVDPGCARLFLRSVLSVFAVRRDAGGGVPSIYVLLLGVRAAYVLDPRRGGRQAGAPHELLVTPWPAIRPRLRCHQHELLWVLDLPVVPTRHVLASRRHPNHFNGK